MVRVEKKLSFEARAANVAQELFEGPGSSWSIISCRSRWRRAARLHRLCQASAMSACQQTRHHLRFCVRAPLIKLEPGRTPRLEHSVVFVIGQRLQLRFHVTITRSGAGRISTTAARPNSSRKVPNAITGEDTESAFLHLARRVSHLFRYARAPKRDRRPRLLDVTPYGRQQILSSPPGWPQQPTLG